jgi:hypothetical protein
LKLITTATCVKTEPLSQFKVTVKTVAMKQFVERWLVAAGVPLSWLRWLTSPINFTRFTLYHPFGSNDGKFLRRYTRRSEEAIYRHHPEARKETWMSF